MPVPPKKDIYISIVFVLFGLVKVMSDRWQVELVVQGYPTRKPHAFDHHFLLWFIKQLMQFGLLFLWMAIDKNWLGCARFRHGDVNQRGDEDRANQQVEEILAGAPENNIGFNEGEDDGDIRPENREAEDNPADDNNRANPDVGIEGEDEAEVDAQNAINNDVDGNGNADDEHIVEEEEGRPLIPPPPINPRRPRRPKKYTKLLYFPPAFFDVTSVLLVYFGQQLTYPSSFGMLKGTMAFFTALLSMAFLAQQLAVNVWIGVVVATLGFGALGISDYVHSTPEGYEKYGIAAGDLQIVMSQIMFATKLIYEEKFIRKHSIHPMKFLGSEASYGLTFASILLLVFNCVDGIQYTEMPNGNIEDVIDACWQFAANWRVVVSVIGSLLCFIIYTYLGLFLVRDQGALPRIMVELLIWALYWGICLILHWEHFFIAQVPGFVVILIGLLLYSHILVIPFLNCPNNDEMIGPEPDEVGDPDDEMINFADGADAGMEDGNDRGDVPMLHPNPDGDDDQPLLGVH